MSGRPTMSCRPGSGQLSRAASASTKQPPSLLWASSSSRPSSRCSSRISHHSERLEAAIEQWESLGLQGAAPASQPQTPAGTDRAASGGPGEEIAVLGLGQAMIDFSGTTDDGFLESLGIAKGGRKLISVEERGAILGALDGGAYSISAGGSLSNTLMGLARLADASVVRAGGRELRVAFAGLIGSDALGAFYTKSMREAGVEVLSAPTPDAATGTVCVLTSAACGERTFASYLGTPAEVPIDPALEAAIARTRLLVIEGYLWELPGARRTIAAAIAAAQRHSCIVAMTAGDAGVVERHHEEIWESIDRGIDLLFTNSGEAEALLRYLPPERTGASASAGKGCAPLLDGLFTGAGASSSSSTAQRAALALGPHCSMVVVTDGASGSYITALGQLHVVPPVWTPEPPVDTCGAGDAYAAGFLYGLVNNMPVVQMGRTAANTAAAVVASRGASLAPEAAAALADTLPTAPVQSFFESLTVQLH